jgi:hypothetical protein
MTSVNFMAGFATDRAYYFIHFSGFKREKVRKMTSLPSSSTFNCSLKICRNTPLRKSAWLGFY